MFILTRGSAAFVRHVVHQPSYSQVRGARSVYDRQKTSRLFGSSKDEDGIIDLQASISKSTSRSISEEDHLTHQEEVFDELSDWFSDRENEVTPDLEPIYKSMAKAIVSQLSQTEEKEQEQMDAAIDEALRCMDILIKDDLKKAMNRLHSFTAE